MDHSIFRAFNKGALGMLKVEGDDDLAVYSGKEVDSVYLGDKVKDLSPVAVATAIIASALIFSVFHYVGPFGDPLTLPSFTFRAVAGLVLSGLYVARGFGIVAWSHALYDIGIALM